MENNVKIQDDAQSLQSCVSGCTLSDAEIEYQIELDEEEDSYWDDDEDEILGYVCNGCGNIQDSDSGFGCDRCGGHCLDPWFS